jgi:hypothetical protein
MVHQKGQPAYSVEISNIGCFLKNPAARKAGSPLCSDKPRGTRSLLRSKTFMQDFAQPGYTTICRLRREEPADVSFFLDDPAAFF